MFFCALCVASKIALADLDEGVVDELALAQWCGVLVPRRALLNYLQSKISLDLGEDALTRIVLRLVRHVKNRQPTELFQ